MNEKVDIYFKLLHPEYEGLSEEEQKRVLSDQTFIKENLDKIELMYQKACSNGKSPEEAIRGAVRLEKANRYFDMLHPDSGLETLSEEEYKRVLSDKTFIKENLDKIELMYQNACSNGKSPEEAIRGAVRLEKTMDTPEGIVKNEEIDSQGITPVDESKFAQIYGKAKGRIKEVVSKIKSFLNIKSKDRNDKSKDENIK